MKMQIVLVCEYTDDNAKYLDDLFKKYSCGNISAEKINDLGLDYFPAKEFFKLVNMGEFDPTAYFCINCDCDLIN